MATQSAPDTSSVQPSLTELPLDDLFAQLDTSAAGLSSAEATRRLTKYGYNELVEKQTNAVLKFFSYLWGPIAWMIEAAAGLSALVRHWYGTILAFVPGKEASNYNFTSALAVQVLKDLEPRLLPLISARGKQV